MGLFMTCFLLQQPSLQSARTALPVITFQKAERLHCLLCGWEQKVWGASGVHNPTSVNTGTESSLFLRLGQFFALTLSSVCIRVRTSLRENLGLPPRKHSEAHLKEQVRRLEGLTSPGSSVATAGCTRASQSASQAPTSPVTQVFGRVRDPVYIWGRKPKMGSSGKSQKVPALAAGISHSPVWRIFLASSEEPEAGCAHTHFPFYGAAPGRSSPYGGRLSLTARFPESQGSQILTAP